MQIGRIVEFITVMVNAYSRLLQEQFLVQSDCWIHNYRGPGPHVFLSDAQMIPSTIALQKKAR